MANYLAVRRTELGLTQKEIAEMIGVSEATVSRWESGAIANMRRDKIKRYAEILKVSPIFIMTGKDDGDDSNDSSSESISLSKAEITFIEKFRTLDPRGQSAVLTVLEHEYNAMQGESPTSPLPRHA